MNLALTEPAAEAPGSAAAPAPTVWRRAPERWRLAPDATLAHACDGRPFVREGVEPYRQFWLSTREWRLLAAFGGAQGRTPEAALAAVLADEAAAGRAAGTRAEAALRRTLAALRDAGLLLTPGDDTSRYDARIAPHYQAQRPFPPGIAAWIRDRSELGTTHRVLDVAGGPGDLALQLAAHSRGVELLDLSRGFLAHARRAARRLGRPLHTWHHSANRLDELAGPYHLVTVAQALHWLDDVAVCRALARLVGAGGHVVVVIGGMRVADDHPLAHLLGHDSVLGPQPRQPFADDVRPVARRLSRLFDALDEGRSPLRLATAQAWVQPRPMGPGFCRGFFTPRHLAATGLGPAGFAADVEARCAAVPAAACWGTQHWAALHFQRAPAATAAAEPAAASAEAALRAGFDRAADPLPWNGPTEP